MFDDDEPPYIDPEQEATPQSDNPTAEEEEVDVTNGPTEYIESLPFAGACPKCGSSSTVAVGVGNVCNACGNQWTPMATGGAA